MTTEASARIWAAMKLERRHDHGRHVSHVVLDDPFPYSLVGSTDVGFLRAASREVDLLRREAA